MGAKALMQRGQMHLRKAAPVFERETTLSEK
jgi:hypothetical protein